MLQNLKNEDLNEKIKSLACDERKLTKTIVEHIAEVDRRKLFLSMAYPSLFEYLTKEIGYSAGAAHRRIDAARLLQRIPEVAQKIEIGTINLAQIAKLQQACRAARKDGRTVAIAEQRAALEQIENKSAEQTELILAREFDMTIKVEERRHVQRDESVRVELTFSKEEMAMLREAQGVLSHKTGGGGLKETILQMAEKVTKAAEFANPKITSTVEVDRVSKTVTPKLRKLILSRDRCCQYIDRSTGKMCGSKYFLEIDHIQPRFAQGSNATANLRVLCKQHNAFRYKAEMDNLT